MSCILYAWRVGERGGGLRGAPAQMNFPTLLVSSGIYLYTHTHPTTFLYSSTLIFSHPLNSFNISFTASCFSQILPSSKPAVAFEDKCDLNRGRGCKNQAAGHLGFLHLYLAAYGVEEGGWQVQCLGTALMSDGVRLLHSPSRGDCHVDSRRLTDTEQIIKRALLVHCSPPKHRLFSFWLADMTRLAQRWSCGSIKKKNQREPWASATWEVWFIRNNMIP